MEQQRKEEYIKPLLVKLDNIRDITFECYQFQCSIPVPPPPPGP